MCREIAKQGKEGKMMLLDFPDKSKPLCSTIFEKQMISGITSSSIYLPVLVDVENVSFPTVYM